MDLIGKTSIVPDTGDRVGDISFTNKAYQFVDSFYWKKTNRAILIPFPELILHKLLSKPPWRCAKDVPFEGSKLITVPLHQISQFI